MDTVVHFYDWFREWFWNEDVWLPPGTGWASLKSSHNSDYRKFSDLWLPVYYAFAILALRAAFEWCIARPLGRCFGIRDTGSPLPHFFRCIIHRIRSVAQFGSNSCGKNYCRLVTENEAKEVEEDDEEVVDQRQIEDQLKNDRARSVIRNFRKKRVRSNSVSKIIHIIHRKSVLDKFSESCWRFVYYIFIFTYGIVTLWNKPWFWDTAYCWYGYPFHFIEPEIWWYYMIELSFYWSLMFSQFVDTVRKDFWVNFVHHITTIMLMSFSWANNFLRMGTLVLVIHDTADFWMESAKMARYCRKNMLCNVLFLIFTAIWFITRCGIYPFKIIYSTTIEAPSLIQFFPVYYIFNCLLLILLVLQLFWSVLILRIVLNAAHSGETEDVRSDDESYDEDCENDSTVPKCIKQNDDEREKSEKLKAT